MFNIFKFFRKEKLSDVAMETEKNVNAVIHKAVMSFYADAMREADAKSKDKED